MQWHTKTIAFILLSGEVILLYSYYTKEGLVYITIAAPSSRQPSFYSKCTQLNTYSSCNVRLVSNIKYTFYIYYYLYPSHSDYRNT